MSMTPQEFEHFVAEAFRAKGYHVEVTRQSGDFGADLLLTTDIAKAVVQVKQYAPANTVGVKDISHVAGSKHYYNCDSAILVTTSKFTAAAIEMANKLNVKLWDGTKLQAFIESAGIAPVLTKPKVSYEEETIALYRHLVTPGEVQSHGLSAACVIKRMLFETDEAERQRKLQRQTETQEQMSYLNSLGTKGKVR